MIVPDRPSHSVTISLRTIISQRTDRRSQREDLAVIFVEPTSYRAYYELLNLEGVEYGDPFRFVPVDLKKDHRSFRTAIQGIEPGSELVRLIDTSLQPVPLPREGLVLTRYLADVLGVQAGEMITVKVLRGRRPVREVPLTALVSEYIGVSAYMDRSALNRLMGEGDLISGVYLATDEAHLEDIYLKLEEIPRVAGSVNVDNSIESFFATMGNQLLTWSIIMTMLAGSIAIGVVYNSARIALAERSRELASLRVLGFRRGEVDAVQSTQTPEGIEEIIVVRVVGTLAERITSTKSAVCIGEPTTQFGDIVNVNGPVVGGHLCQFPNVIGRRQEHQLGRIEQGFEHTEQK